MSSAAVLEEAREGDRRVIRFGGWLTLDCIGDLPDRLAAIHDEKILIDLSKVERIDTVGAWLVYRLAHANDAEAVGADEHAEVLLDQVAHADQPVKIRPDRTPPLYR